MNVFLHILSEKRNDPFVVKADGKMGYITWVLFSFWGLFPHFPGRRGRQQASGKPFRPSVGWVYQSSRCLPEEGQHELYTSLGHRIKWLWDSSFISTKERQVVNSSNISRLKLNPMFYRVSEQSGSIYHLVILVEWFHPNPTAKPALLASLNSCFILQSPPWKSWTCLDMRGCANKTTAKE